MKVEIVDAKDVDFKAITVLNWVATVDWDLIGHCYARSEERWIGLANNEIACIWGLIPPTVLSDRAYLWLFHTPLVEHHKHTFIRHSQIQMKRMLQVYPIIVGDCRVANGTGRRWLQWLGATFGPPCGDLSPFEIKAKSNG
jgi:hypothetical protein